MFRSILSEKTKQQFWKNAILTSKHQRNKFFKSLQTTGFYCKLDHLLKSWCVPNYHILFCFDYFKFNLNRGYFLEGQNFDTIPSIINFYLNAQKIYTSSDYRFISLTFSLSLSLSLSLPPPISFFNNLNRGW